jgi:hypothetical protein
LITCIPRVAVSGGKFVPLTAVALIVETTRSKTAGPDDARRETAADAEDDRSQGWALTTTLPSAIPHGIPTPGAWRLPNAGSGPGERASHAPPAEWSGDAIRSSYRLTDDAIASMVEQPLPLDPGRGRGRGRRSGLSDSEAICRSLLAQGATTSALAGGVRLAAGLQPVAGPKKEWWLVETLGGARHGRRRWRRRGRARDRVTPEITIVAAGCAGVSPRLTSSTSRGGASRPRTGRSRGPDCAARCSCRRIATHAPALAGQGTALTRLRSSPLGSAGA